MNANVGEANDETPEASSLTVINCLIYHHSKLTLQVLTRLI
jgi:hypothetical protein